MIPYREAQFSTGAVCAVVIFLRHVERIVDYVVVQGKEQRDVRHVVKEGNLCHWENDKKVTEDCHYVVADHVRVEQLGPEYLLFVIVVQLMAEYS